MTTQQHKAEILARIGDTRYHINQASAEGAARRGEFGPERQLLALSAWYKELKAAGQLEAAAAVKAQGVALYKALYN
jgi:hypothetical protein